MMAPKPKGNIVQNVQCIELKFTVSVPTLLNVVQKVEYGINITAALLLLYNKITTYLPSLYI
jgi:hypothetical protein